MQSLQYLVINLLKYNLFHGNELLTNLSDKINPQFLKYVVISLCLTYVFAMIVYFFLKPNKTRKRFVL